MKFELARTVPLLLLATLASRSDAGVVIVDAQGAGSFTSLQAAADAAASGDVLLVKSGTYASLSVTAKSLAVVADAGAAVTVQNGVQVLGLTSAQSFVLSGVVVRGGSSKHALRATSSAGPVRIEACTLLGADGIPNNGPSDFCVPCQPAWLVSVEGGDGARISGCADVSFTACELRGGLGYTARPCSGMGGDGLESSASFVTTYDALCFGGTSGIVAQTQGLDCVFDAAAGGTGARVQGVGIFASGSTFQGGGGANGDPAWGISASGGDGIRLSAGAGARLLDNVLLGGPGGALFGGPAGAPIVGGDVFHHAGTAHRSSASRVVRDDASVVLECEGEPGASVSWTPSTSSRALYLPSQRGVRIPLPRALPQATPALLLGALDAAGTLAASLPVVDLPTGAARVVFTQTTNRNAVGEVTLGSPRVVVVLDSIY